MDTNITFIAITYHEDKLLFLKRNQPPYVWGPPSGHLKVGERMETAIHREMLEETGCRCEVLIPVGVWQGPHRGQEVFNVTYVCRLLESEVRLSEEHSEWKWVPIGELEAFQKETVLDLSRWLLWLELAEIYSDKMNPNSTVSVFSRKGQWTSLNQKVYGGI